MCMSLNCGRSPEVFHEPGWSCQHTWWLAWFVSFLKMPVEQRNGRKAESSSHGGGYLRTGRCPTGKDEKWCQERSGWLWWVLVVPGPYLLLPNSRLISPCSSDRLLFSLFLEHARVMPASGPLHELFPLPHLLPLLILQLPTSCPSRLPNHHDLERAFLTTHYKTLLCLLLFCPEQKLITLWKNLVIYVLI